MTKLPNKNKHYKYTDSTIWHIWDGEDFKDDLILLYECETGEDMSVTLENFKKYFVECSITI